MSLPRIPPPPRSSNATPIPAPLGTADLLGSYDEHQQQQNHHPPIQPRTGHLIALDTPLKEDDRNPHLQMYTGPTADFEQPVTASPAVHSPTRSPTRHHAHTHPRLHPPRRLSEIFSSAGPSSPPVVSSDAGNAGFTVSSAEEFGVFKSGGVREGEAGEEHGRPSSSGRQRRMSSFDGLWRGLNLGTGSVGTFPARRQSGDEAKQHADVFHDDDEDKQEPSAQSTSTEPSSSTSTANSSWKRAAGGFVASTLGSTLGTTLKAKSKWKTVLGPSTFHPALNEPPPLPSGYALHGWTDETLAAPTTTAKPISISHNSPFAPSSGTGTSATPSSTSTAPISLGNPFANPLSGAPGFRREDTYLASSRPTHSQTETEGPNWKGTTLLGRREGTDAVLDEDAADAVRRGGSDSFTSD